MSAEVKLWRDEAIHYHLLIAIRVLSVYPTSNLLRNDHVDKKGRFYFKNCNRWKMSLKKLEGVTSVMILRRLAARAVSHTRDVSQQEHSTA